MSAAIAGEKMRWAVAAGGAMAVVGLLLTMFRLPPTPTVLPEVRSRHVVVLAQEGAASSALKDETMMRDWTPLFLPTEHNATLQEFPRLEPGKTFLDNETLKLSYGEAELTLGRELPPLATLGGKPVEKTTPVDALVADGPGQNLTGFGRNDLRIEPMEARGGFVEVVATATGKRMLLETLAAGSKPPGEKPWQPMEFLAAVDAAGLVGPLILAEGSRVEEVDAYFRNFLARTFRLGERLPPGFYRVVVGP